MPTEIPCNCLAMQKTVETWAEELAKEAIKGGIYKSKSGKEHSVANAIASVSITRDSLKLEEVQTPESFLGNIALLRTKMNKLYKGLGLKTYLLQSPNLGLQKYTATRQVLGKMRKENAEEEKQYKAGIMERLVKEKQKQAKEIKIRFIEQIEDANEQSEYGIIQILDDSGYNVEGSSYEKKILVDSSLMKKEVYEEVSIRKYKKYVLDNKLEKELDVDITLRKGVNASYYEAKLRTLEMKLAKVGKKVFGSDAGEGSIEEQLETLEAKGIQAKQEDGQILKGMLALHVGSGAQLSTDAQSVGNKGSGEKGRILTAYYEGVIKENKGWAEFKKPVHRKKVLNTHGMSENDPIAAGLKQTMSFSIADAAITTAVIAGTVLGGLAGGQVWIGAAIGFALNTAVNASITAADVGTGYRNGDEAWQEFAVNTAIEGVTTAVTLGLAQGAGALAGSASKGIMGGAKVAGKSVPAARSILAGATSGAIKGAGSMVGAMSSRYIGAGIRSMSKGKSFGDGMGDQMQLDWDTGAYANDLIGVAASMAGGAVSGGFQAFVPTSLGTNAISNFAGALTNSAVDYGARRVQSGIEDGWDNWEGSGMKFNVLNTNDLGMGGSTGLLELELGGKYGVQGRVGTGGIGVSGSALAAMRADAQNYRKAAAYRNSDRDDVSNNWAAMLAMYSSGDEAAQGLVDELEQGSAEFAIGTGDAVGQTILGDDGIRRIYVSSDMASTEGGGIQFGDTLASQLQGATLGVHEAYRDGVVGSNEEQAIETAQATIGHTVFASRVAQRFGDSVYGGNGFGATVMNDLEVLKRGGIEALAGHAVNNYDSSADYWKVKRNKDGSIAYEWDGSYDLDMSEFGGGTIEASKIKDQAGLIAQLILNPANGSNAQQTKAIMATFLENSIYSTNLATLTSDLHTLGVFGEAAIAIKDVIANDNRGGGYTDARENFNTAIESMLGRSSMNFDMGALSASKNPLGPTDGGTITGRYGNRIMDKSLVRVISGKLHEFATNEHNGIDIAAGNDSLFYAPTKGKIGLHEKWGAAAGFEIKWGSGDDELHFGHNSANAIDIFTQAVLFSGGFRISGGLPIGKTGIRGKETGYDKITGSSTGPHLHLSALLKKTESNPNEYYKKLFNNQQGLFDLYEEDSYSKYLSGYDDGTDYTDSYLVDNIRQYGDDDFYEDYLSTHKDLFDLEEKKWQQTCRIFDACPYR